MHPFLENLINQTIINDGYVNLSIYFELIWLIYFYKLRKIKSFDDYCLNKRRNINEIYLINFKNLNEL